MAQKVTAQVLGGQPKVFDGVSTVEEVKQKMAATSYAATVNGEPASDDYELDDYEFVTLAPPSKGA